MHASAPIRLPQPDAASAEHERVVRSHIANVIDAAGGAIPFVDYMDHALYAPGIGYYSAGSAKFAASGDFVTAPELGSLFAEVVARQCLPVLAETGGDIVEFGAGSGRLAAGVLAALDRSGAVPARYRIVEVSADLRERQRAAIALAVPHLVERVRWEDAPPASAWSGIAIGNEVLDALPVERFRIDAAAVQQQRVCWRDGAPAGVWAPAPDALARAVDALQSTLGRRLPDDYRSEYCTMLDAWLATAVAGLQRGVVLFSDYGYGRDDFYADARRRGTLTCHFRHHVHDDPFVNVGIQDITAWVDFSRVAEALDANGLGYLGYTTQAQFLLHGGLGDALAAAGDDPRVAAEARELTLPGGMGERFRMIGFHRDCALALGGFAGRDLGGRL